MTDEDEQELELETRLAALRRYRAERLLAVQPAQPVPEPVPVPVPVPVAPTLFEVHPALAQHREPALAGQHPGQPAGHAAEGHEDYGVAIGRHQIAGILNVQFFRVLFAKRVRDLQDEIPSKVCLHRRQRVD